MIKSPIWIKVNFDDECPYPPVRNKQIFSGGKQHHPKPQDIANFLICRD